MELVLMAEDIPEDGRCRFFCRAWRVIKSLVVHAVVGGSVGFFIGGGAGAVIGAVTGAAFGVGAAAGDACVNFGCSTLYMKCSTKTCYN